MFALCASWSPQPAFRPSFARLAPAITMCSADETFWRGQLADVQAELEAQLAEARSQTLKAEMEHNALLEAKAASDKAAAQAKLELDIETNRGFWRRIFG